MKRIVTWPIRPALCVVLCVAGCGSEEETTEPQVASDKLLSEMTESELQTFCTRVTDSLKDVAIGPGECPEATGTQAGVPTHEQCMSAPLPCLGSLVEACWSTLATDKCGANTTSGPCVELGACLQESMVEDQEIDKDGNITYFTEVPSLGVRLDVTVDETSSATDGVYAVTAARNYNPVHSWEHSRTWRCELSDAVIDVKKGSGPVGSTHSVMVVEESVSAGSINLQGENTITAYFYQHYYWWWFGFFPYFVGGQVATVDGQGGAITAKFMFY